MTNGRDCFASLAMTLCLSLLRLLASNQIVPEADVQDPLEECNQLIAILTMIVKKTKENAQ